ncbi:MAG: hypothetical protein PHT69_17060 [Bacteroidales bacterium]|nr:hypothetical protein [Bacteroidales bacterium]
MKKTLKQELKQHRLLIISLLFSVGLLVIFFIFQYYELKVLNLDIKWLVLSSIPILIGLFIGGYIKNFKGFGIELETNLKGQIPMTVVSKIDMADSPGINKQSLELLYNLSDKERDKISRLRFINGKRNYYDLFAIVEHYNALRHLRFIEVVDSDGEFLYLISASKLKINNEISHEKIRQFIQAIETENIEETYPDAVSDFIITTDNIIEAYKKICKSQQSNSLLSLKESLPILNEKRKMVGTVSKQRLEAKITQEVLKEME